LVIIGHYWSLLVIIGHYWSLLMFERNLRIVLYFLSRHADVLSIHLLLSFKTGPSGAPSALKYNLCS
jgi:hypothetical protein